MAVHAGCAVTLRTNATSRYPDPDLRLPPHRQSCTALNLSSCMSCAHKQPHGMHTSELHAVESSTPSCHPTAYTCMVVWHAGCMQTQYAHSMVALLSALKEV